MSKMAFGRHDVWISSSCLHVAKEGLSIKVKQDKIIGTLTVTDTHVIWTPKGKRSKRGLPWGKFAKLMADNMEA